MSAAEPTDGAAPTGLSRLDELRAEFKKPKKERRLFKRLPCQAFKGRLAIEYKVLGIEQATPMVNLMAGASNRDDNGAGILTDAQDALINAVVMLHAHDPDDPKADAMGLVPLHVWLELESVGPLQFDARLAEALDIPNGTARELLARLFDGEDLPLISQAGELAQWTMDASDEDAQDFTPGS